MNIPAMITVIAMWKSYLLLSIHDFKAQIGNTLDCCTIAGILIASLVVADIFGNLNIHNFPLALSVTFYSYCTTSVNYEGDDNFTSFSMII